MKTTMTKTMAATVQSSQFLSNFRSLRDVLMESTGLKALKPVERLDEHQLERLLSLLESGRYRISAANWLRVRERAYQMALQEFGNRQLRNERTAEENRYEEDNRPVAPNVTWHTQGIRGYVIGLEDGRLARRIDQSRAVPFCGLQIPVVLSELERAQDDKSRVRWITGSVQCPRCDGYHLQAVPVSKPASSEPARTSDAEITCPHCHCHGVSIRFEREGLVLTAHCLCGWEGVTSLLGLDPALVEQNTRSVLAAPIRDVEDEEEVLMPEQRDGMADTSSEEDCVEEEFEESDGGDLVETLVGMTEGAESPADADSSDVETIQEDLDEIDLEALLTRDMVQFWASREQRELRRLLLDYTMRGELAPSMTTDQVASVSRDRLALVWTVAATLTQGCGRMSAVQQQEFVSWLVHSADEELRQFLPEGTEDSALPNVYAKIRCWMRSCRERVAKFRSESAGVRLLSRQFGVSETAFRTAIRVDAVA